MKNQALSEPQGGALLQKLPAAHQATAFSMVHGPTRLPSEHLAELKQTGLTVPNHAFLAVSSPVFVASSPRARFFALSWRCCPNFAVPARCCRGLGRGFSAP